MAEITRKTSQKDKPQMVRHRLPLGLVRSCMGVWLGLLLASPAQAISMTFTFGDIEITPEAAPKGTSSHGYLEYVFHVVNTSAERPHIVTLSIPFEKFYVSGDSIRELRRTVQVGAKETVRVSLLQPDHPPIGGQDVAVTIDGHRQERELPLRTNQSARPYHYRSYGYSAVSPEPLLLLGPRVKPLPTLDPAPGSPMGSGGPPRSPAMPPGMPPPMRGMSPGMLAGAMSLRRPPAEILEGWLPLLPLGWNGPTYWGALVRLTLAWQMGETEWLLSKPGLPARGFQFVTAETWSNNWLAYTRYDGIIVTAEEWNALPAGTQTALWQYVETGGVLLVLGPIDLRGLSAVLETNKEGGWLKVRAGFGTCYVSPDDKYDTWDAERFARLMNDWRNTGSWSASRRSTSDANQEFPIIDDLGIPVRGLFALMFLFVLGIGPVNIFVLSRLKRRIWLLWTTPVLSLCTCLAVFGYMLISEGWSGRLRSETLTLLDETTHRATTVGWTSVYSPLTLGDGLHFCFETEVIPQRFFEGSNRDARLCIIDWSQDQHLASGWVEARIPAHFKIRKSELRRERVALHRERDGRWSMVNGLGAAISHFWYADAQGQIHEVEDVAPGARALLTLTEKECQAPVRTMQSILFNSQKWASEIQMVVQKPQDYLRPGFYLAEVEDSPFLEEALRNARTRKLHALIVGFSKQGDGAKVPTNNTK